MMMMMVVVVVVVVIMMMMMMKTRRRRRKRRVVMVMVMMINIIIVVVVVTVVVIIVVVVVINIISSSSPVTSTEIRSFNFVSFKVIRVSPFCFHRTYLVRKQQGEGIRQRFERCFQQSTSKESEQRSTVFLTREAVQQFSKQH